ncbi:MAG TPA: hypothetical protein VGC89_09275 [Pyrinomonadaceae bacterium]
MKRIFTSFVLALCFGCAALVQAQDPKLAKAAKNGKALPTRIMVGKNVTAQAVLIPRVDARRIFGKEIADNYAVIEVNVGNKSSDAALIIHGIFIDYTRWALSGTPNQPTAMVDGVARDRSEPFQASTNPNQVASEEYRVVRGQLLDAQMWSKRNWAVRLLTLAGNLAGAYAFSINEEGIIRGLNAFSGVVVPGIKEAWPDGTIEQLNRVSDFGYQANKVIGKQGAEVIVCFFPIDRFLTPGFKQLFLKSPALFFAPLQMLVDKKLKKEADEILRGIDSNLSVDDLRGLLPCYLRIVQRMRFGANESDDPFVAQIHKSTDETCFSEFGLKEETDTRGKLTGNVVPTDRTEATRKKFNSLLALDFISQMSLNTVTVTVDGVMTVDITTIPARIDAVAFDKTKNCNEIGSPCFWAETTADEGIRTGTITGSYLTGGSVEIAEAEALGITEVKTITEESSDQIAHFSFKLSKPIPPGTKLHFLITKPKAGSGGPEATIDSLPSEYPVGFPLGTQAITNVVQKDDKLTVTGINLYDMPLVVTLHPPDGEAVTVDRSLVTIKSSNQLEVTIPPVAKTPGCWQLTATVGTMMGQRPLNNSFIVLPSIESATRDADEIVVEGAGLDASDCAGALTSFHLLNGNKSFRLERLNTSTDTEVRLKLPSTANGADATWKLRAQFAGRDLDKSPVQLEVKPQ